MPQSPKEPSLADVQQLLKETAEWLDVANHAQTEVEWRIEVLSKRLPPDDPALLALMNGKRKGK